MTFRQKIQNLFFPLGSVRKIRIGYLKGFKILVSENSRWAPFVGNFEPSLQKIMVNVVNPGDIVYDLGSNSGLHGLLMAQLVGKTGKVYNFEPLQKNIDECEENYRLNNIENFVNIQAAIFYKNGEEPFLLVDQIGHVVSRNYFPSENLIKVRTITLDSFIAENNPGPALIKIDIEGMEAAALYGFSKRIKEFSPLLIIELHSDQCCLEVGDFLQHNGYLAYSYNPYKKLKFSLLKNWNKVFSEDERGNIFCIPPGKKLEDFTFSK